MGLKYRSETKELVDMQTGETIDAREYLALRRRIAGVMGGRVLEIGLGLGILRRLLWREKGVRKVTTYELRQDIVTAWREGDHGFEEHAQQDDDPSTVVVGDGWAEVQVESGRNAKNRKYHGVVFESYPADPLTLARMTLLAGAFSRPGQRVVVVSPVQHAAIPGFVRAFQYAEDAEGGVGFAVFDRAGGL